ncbi:sugar phosphate isomerase/epimerase family protein [Galbibacter pacificus]|uniref:TIM barrel protein n=1 Tax=Galbibacter pacificus TaxID=2996052 RepID=A0ABT6FSE7_9FLAO|nr:TIM barrel protein [Galbibacter pacificus]MDG3582695.1 TIM barrel protein [Galbibacter pacificus]MDG3586186.1 TIM barrel protein [Galbibacter pacificus]
MKRRKFIRNTSSTGLAISLLGMYACKKTSTKKEIVTKKDVFEPFFKLSLAQWSIHKMIWEENFDPMNFAKKAKELGFSGLEYVNQLYNKEIEKRGNTNEAIISLANDLKKRSEEHQMHNQIMMVDLQGEENLLATPDEAIRKQAVENHKIWVDATSILGCHSMRINLFGSLDEGKWKESSVASLTELSEYASAKNVNIIVENHGYLSSNGALMAEVMATVNKKNCGTLPDFGNFCLRREGNELWGTPCIEEYDKYKGVEELMPFAKGVSAKSFNFDENGNETTIDFLKMMKIVKDAGFNGYVGVEYEGEELPEEKGILATKALLIEVAKKINTGAGS